VNKLWARFGAYGVSAFEGIISPAYWVLRLDQERVEPNFLHHLLRSAVYMAEIGRISRNQPPNGFDLAWENFRLLRVPTIELRRQRDIAEALQGHMERLNDLIKHSQRHRDLFRELLDVRFHDLANNSLFGVSGTGT